VSPAKGQLDTLSTFGERGVAAVAVDLQDACEVTEMRLRPFPLAVGL